MTPRARVVRAGGAPLAKPLLAPGVSDGQTRRIVREEAEGRQAAERIVREARAEADRVIVAARAEAERAAEGAVREAHEEAQAKLAAQWLVLRREERRELDGSSDRIIAVAVALAERLLGASLNLDPARVLELARGVIAEAGGARRAVIDAHPLDAATLTAHLTDVAGPDMQSIEIREDATLARGDLRLHTDIGIIDARLAPRFDRLAAALRDALG